MVKIGHNGGPAMGGQGWRSHCWTVARQNLLPNLPLEVVRTRVRRAKDLGLDYKTYAGVRATTGHDLVAFLFSSNALRVDRLGVVAPDVAQKLGAVQADRLALAQGIAAGDLLAANPASLTDAAAAPAPFAAFRDQAQALRAALGKRSGDRVLLICDAPWESDWVSAGKLAGLLPAARYFSDASLNR